MIDLPHTELFIYNKTEKKKTLLAFNKEFAQSKKTAISIFPPVNTQKQAPGEKIYM